MDIHIIRAYDPKEPKPDGRQYIFVLPLNNQHKSADRHELKPQHQPHEEHQPTHHIEPIYLRPQPLYHHTHRKEIKETSHEDKPILYTVLEPVYDYNPHDQYRSNYESPTDSIKHYLTAPPTDSVPVYNRPVHAVHAKVPNYEPSKDIQALEQHAYRPISAVYTNEATGKETHPADQHLNRPVHVIFAKVPSYEGQKDKIHPAEPPIYRPVQVDVAKGNKYDAPPFETHAVEQSASLPYRPKTEPLTKPKTVSLLIKGLQQHPTKPLLVKIETHK